MTIKERIKEELKQKEIQQYQEREAAAQLQIAETAELERAIKEIANQLTGLNFEYIDYLHGKCISVTEFPRNVYVTVRYRTDEGTGERYFSVGIGLGIGIPHCTLGSLEHFESEFVSYLKRQKII